MFPYNDKAKWRKVCGIYESNYTLCMWLHKIFLPCLFQTVG